MPRARFHRLPPERRRAVLDAAARAFAEHGYAGASLNRVLAEAGMSKGAAYYCFDDKADLFATVVEDAWATVAAALPADPASLGADEFWPTLEALYLRQLRAFADTPWAWRAVRAARPLLAEGGDAALRHRLEPIVGWLVALGRRASELGFVRRDLPEELVLALLSGADQALDAWLLTHPEAAGDEALARAAFGSLRRLVQGV